jgi:hypothetical protein
MVLGCRLVRMTSTTHTEGVAVRVATDADADALRDLALLDSSRRLTGPVVVAEIDGTPVAARSLADGRAVADPFVRTADVLVMLETYAARFATTAEPRRRPWTLTPRLRAA